MTPEQRGIYLNKLAQLFEENAEQLAAIESLDNGKAFSIAKVDVQMAAGCLRYYGGWADKIEGKVIDTMADTFNYTKQEPVSSAQPPTTPLGSVAYCVFNRRLVSVLRSSHGTSPFLCGHGRSVRPSPVEIPSCSRPPNRHHSRASMPLS